MCAGCPFAMTLHTGCIVSGKVEVYWGKVQSYGNPEKEKISSPNSLQSGLPLATEQSESSVE